MWNNRQIFYLLFMLQHLIQTSCAICWSDEYPSTFITTTLSTSSSESCPPPPYIDNAILPANTTCTVGSMAVYVCEQGFTRTVGDNALECVQGQNGLQWTDFDMALVCQRCVTVDVMVGVTTPLALVAVIATVSAAVLFFRRQKSSSSIEGGAVVPSISFKHGDTRL